MIRGVFGILVTMLMVCSFIAGCKPKNYRPPFNADYAEQNEAIRDLFTETLPTPPEGFKWIMFHGVKMRKPIAWTEYKTDKVYTSSIESVAKEGKFETGLTIQRLINVKKTKKMSALQYAVAFIKTFEKDKNNKTLKLTFGKANEHESVVYRYRNAPPNLEPIIVHKFIIANDIEDFVVIVTVEAPEKTWDKFWDKHGLIMLKQVGVEQYTGRP